MECRENADKERRLDSVSLMVEASRTWNAPKLRRISAFATKGKVSHGTESGVTTGLS
jgi:hypothetical protein